MPIDFESIPEEDAHDYPVAPFLDFAREQERPHGHVYHSTACLHEEHEYCKGDRGMAGRKRPAECKFCRSGCICDCHKEADDVAP